MNACRNALATLDLSTGTQAGLLLSRYLKAPVGDDAHKDTRDKKDGARSTLYRAAQMAASKATEVYKLAFDRWKAQFPAEHVKELHVQGRLIVGLGGENVLETGLTLHHTYGVPFIPGSALKGLAAHYAAQVWGAVDRDWKKDRKRIQGKHHQTVFGAQDDAGHIIFHDALITPDSLKKDGKSGLVLDVITPHHGDYYAGKKRKAKNGNEELVSPTDFDDPNPVTFLSVAGTFIVAVSCDVPNEDGRKWSDLALKLLCEALENWGVGGKTSSGYGRLADKPGQVSQSATAAQQAIPVKRPQGHVVSARFLGPREGGKKGFQAKEEGKDPGIIVGLTAFSPPDPLPAVNSTIQLEIQDDSPKNLQYRWPAVKKHDAEKGRKIRP